MAASKNIDSDKWRKDYDITCDATGFLLLQAFLQEH